MRHTRLVIAACLLAFALSSACALDPDDERPDDELVEDTALADEQASVRSPLKEFETDGCSTAPDGTLGEPKRWLHCCIEHDQAYFMGGTYDRKVAADTLFYVCMAQECGDNIATLYLAAVTAFGGPFLPTDYRWGYGWDYDPVGGFDDLTPAEIRLAQEALDRWDGDVSELVDDFPPAEWNQFDLLACEE
jgi:hypothetical protein